MTAPHITQEELDAMLEELSALRDLITRLAKAFEECSLGFHSEHTGKYSACSDKWCKKDRELLFEYRQWKGKQSA